jgi:hypothetical protein
MALAHHVFVCSLQELLSLPNISLELALTRAKDTLFTLSQHLVIPDTSTPFLLWGELNNYNIVNSTYITNICDASGLRISIVQKVPNLKYQSGQRGPHVLQHLIPHTATTI